MIKRAICIVGIIITSLFLINIITNNEQHEYKEVLDTETPVGDSKVITVGEQEVKKEYETYNDGIFNIKRTDDAVLEVTYLLCDIGVIIFTNEDKVNKHEYKYVIEDNKTNIITLTDGVGHYSVKTYTAYRNSDKSSTVLDSHEDYSITVEKTDDSIYKISTTLVNYKDNIELIDKETGGLNSIDEILKYFDDYEYNQELADAITNGTIRNYKVNLQDTLNTHRGICYDNATAMTAILRHKGYTAQMVYGYVGSVYHAWVRVKQADQNGNPVWVQYDPTTGRTSYKNNMDTYVITEYH